MADFYTDQAAGLYRLMGNHSVQVIALATGCRGIGRSTLLANFAVRLSKLGRTVLIIDTNHYDNNNNTNNNNDNNNGKDNEIFCDLLNYFGLNSVNKAISKKNLTNLVENKLFNNILIPATKNIFILSAHNLDKLKNSNSDKYEELLKELNEFEPSIDTILVDGYIQNDNFLPFILASQETILLVSTTADSVSKIYHIVKQISEINKSKNNKDNIYFHLLVNQVKSPNEAHFIFDKLAQVIQKRNIATLQYLGYLPFDNGIKHSAKLDEPYIIQFPNSLFSQSISHLANILQTWRHQQENKKLHIIDDNENENENNEENKNNKEEQNTDNKNKYFSQITDFFNYLQNITIKK